MKEFHIPAKALKANPFFLDINKKDLTKKMERAKHDTNLFTLYEGHLKNISQVFADCPAEHQFWLHSGKGLKNLRELYDEFKLMTDAIYSHHINKDKNDFASWVRHVLKDDKLAIALGYSNSRQEAISAIEHRVDEIVKDSDSVDESVFSDAIKQLKSKNSKLEDEIRKKKEWLINRHKELEGREKAAVEKENVMQQRYRELERQEHELRAQMIIQTQKVARMRQEEQQVETEKKKEEGFERIYQELDTLIESARLHITDKNMYMAKQLIPQIRVLYTQIDKDNPRKREFWYKLSELKKHGEAALAKPSN